ncbi:MAG: hypothetical protein Q8M99_11785 [Methylotenera sp.]|nr:hypothetical protein [Methylotenera sp.]
MAFKFDIGDAVVIEVSGEGGIVIGRAEYVSSESNYLIRYKSSDFKAVEQWWSDSALIKS